MSMIQSDLLLGQEGGAGYTISRSLRFNSSDSAFLSRTPASAGNRKTWTWAGWVKRSGLGTRQFLVSAYFANATYNTDDLMFTTGDSITYWNRGDTEGTITTAAVFRDCSAWYHIVLAYDSTQSTASDRVKLYVNGAQVTTFSSATYPSQNRDSAFNSTNSHQIARRSDGSENASFNGYLADVHFIDGQALTPSSFTEVSATTGQLIPKAYTGTFTGNSFWLKFADNSAATATTLGKDSSGLGNNWTPNNLSVTAGAGNDSLVDTPTSYGTDTGAGGEVRGNYATWNALYKLPTTYTPMTLSNGNLDVVSPNASGIAGCPCVLSTVAASSGKYFFEVNVATAGNMLIGIAQASYIPTAEGGIGAGALSYYVDGSVFNSSNSSTAYGASYTSGNVIGVAFDADAKTCTFYKNGSSQGQLSWTFGTPVTPLIGDYGGVSTCSASANFGQRQWAYAPPAGFKALCDTNLPAPVVAKPSTVMDVKLYTGNGSTQTISGLGFSPDLVWMKARSIGYSHTLIDSVRGATKTLSSSMTVQEYTEPTGPTAFTSDGWSMSGDVTYVGSVNANGQTYAAWTWDAGSTTVTNTQGSITSQVRANPSAGFSIVSYSGNLSTSGNVTVGHGLGVAPAFIIGKSRNVTGADNGPWTVFHSYDFTQYLRLNTTAAATGIAANGGGTPAAPTSSVFSTYYLSGSNVSGNNYVAYCFAPVAGYSSFGSYTGNGSSDGPFIYTGFRPRWVMYKSSSSAYYWVINDAARDSYNASNKELFPNDSLGETVVPRDIDFLSNGFKLRNTGTTNNQSGGTYIYAAFAENPFQYARAR